MFVIRGHQAQFRLNNTSITRNVQSHTLQFIHTNVTFTEICNIFCVKDITDTMLKTESFLQLNFQYHFSLILVVYFNVIEIGLERKTINHFLAGFDRNF